LDSIKTNEDISLKSLTLKFVALLALLSGQRIQTLLALKVEYCVIENESAVFYIDKLLKTSRPGRHLTPISLKRFAQNDNLCIVKHLELYLRRTKPLRQHDTCDNKLFISFMKPHRPVGADTISRWIKLIMSAAGIDVTSFKAHSTRAASTSAGHSIGVPVDKILESGGWQNTRTFGKFYNKPIVAQQSLGDELLASFHANKQ
ncbi:MAG: tyrosine-type recombinase/integrase, partial [Candidatus Omnitrophica bacterium]|nr:tyrosine-type recombinase/integrase [Candidatus Omnitrophota bacterium]